MAKSLGTNLGTANSCKQRRVAPWVIEVPVSQPETRAEICSVVDAITPEAFRAVGEFCKDFSQPTDEAMRAFLAATAGGCPKP